MNKFEGLNIIMYLRCNLQPVLGFREESENCERKYYLLTILN